MNNTTKADFGPIRSVFWPVYPHEVKLIVPILLMLFLTCFNYTILKNLKDHLVLTVNTASGAEAIPFIKLWAVLPMAILSAYIFTKLTNRYSQEKVYYIMVSGFLCIYAILGFVVIPRAEYFQLDGFADFLSSILPGGMRGLISSIRHWSITVFYVFCELWSSLVWQVLFWGFANEITKVKEAKRYYSLFAAGANVSAIFAGIAGVSFATLAFNPAIPFGKNAWEQTIMEIVLVVLVLGVLMMAIFWWLNRHVLASPAYEGLHAARPSHLKVKKRLSLRDSFSYLCKSKYLICIAVIVVAYNLVINVVEVVWKDQLRQLSSNDNDCMIYLSYVTIVVGVISTISAFFVGKVIGWIGWTRTALITPVLMLVTALGFFTFMFLRQIYGDVGLEIMGMTPLALAVLFGGMQNAVSRVSKYSFFDSTKEMAFIPLDHETKLKGKAAIDGVGSRLGKSGGAVIHQSLLLVFGSLAFSAPFIAALIMVVIAFWFAATKALGIEFAKLARSKHDEAEGVTDIVSSENTPILSKS